MLSGGSGLVINQNFPSVSFEAWELCLVSLTVKTPDSVSGSIDHGGVRQTCENIWQSKFGKSAKGLIYLSGVRCEVWVLAEAWAGISGQQPPKTSGRPTLLYLVQCHQITDWPSTNHPALFSDWAEFKHRESYKWSQVWPDSVCLEYKENAGTETFLQIMWIQTTHCLPLVKCEPKPRHNLEN